MKALIRIAIILSLSFIGSSFVLLDILEPVGTERVIPKNMERKLRKDAARIAIRMESQGDELVMQSVEIPKKKSSLIYDILATIYLSDISEARRVFDCNVRASSDIAIDKFWIVYRKDADWAELLGEGVSEAEGEVGDLMEDYELFITKKRNWDSEHDIITIESAQLYNIAALSNKFMGIEGVEEVKVNNSTNALDTKSDDIQLNRSENKWMMKFIRNWSEIGGTTKSHTWSFAIEQELSSVEFKGEEGDDFPDWMRCQVYSSILPSY